MEQCKTCKIINSDCKGCKEFNKNIRNSDSETKEQKIERLKVELYFYQENLKSTKDNYKREMKYLNQQIQRREQQLKELEDNKGE